MNNSKNNNLQSKQISDYIKYSKSKQQQFVSLYENTPLSIKILNIIVPFILLYYFTVFNYKLWLSIIFVIITFISIFMLNKIVAIIFLIFYIIIVVDYSQRRKSMLGNPILQTDIIKNGSPFNCNNNSLTIQSNTLSQDLNGGYFTYSFWLYVNGTNNNINKSNNWYDYRYDEWKSIFYRGNSVNNLVRGEDSEELNGLDLSGLVQFPGFWLTPKLNNLVIVFQNESLVERLEINNIEFNKWINIVVVVESKSVSIYINGLLDRTLNLYQSPSVMNQYNIYVANDKLLSKNQDQSGFAGSIAELTYYNYALTVNEIMDSYKYYKEIINNYQNMLIKNNYTFTNGLLITNDDTLS